MPPIPKQEKQELGTLCDICGDVGFTFCLVTCTKCHNYHQHIYCMGLNLQKVPETWYCDACRPHNTVISEDSGLNDSPALNPPSFSHEVKRENICSHSFCQFPGEEMQASSEKQIYTDTGNGSSTLIDTSKKIAPPKFGKVKYLPLEDASILSSGVKRKRSPRKGGFYSRTRKRPTLPVTPGPHSYHREVHASKSPRHSNPLMLSCTPHRMNLRRRPSKFFQQLRGQKLPPLVPSIYSVSASLKKTTKRSAMGKPLVSSSYVLNLKSKERNDPKRHQSSPNPIGYVARSVNEIFCNNKMKRSVYNAGKEVSVDLNNYAKKEDPFDAFGHSYEDGKLSNPPAIEVAWKGSIEILDTLDELYSGFQAHHPGEISQKAYELSKVLPGTLRFMLLSCCDVWPEIFKKIPPSGHDIALYFFPGDFYRSRVKYESLQKFLQTHDLCLRSCIGSVDLLIFSSQKLPVDSHKLNQRFYIWGVCRSMKRQLSSVSLKRNEQFNHVQLLELRNGEMVNIVKGKAIPTGDDFMSLTGTNHSYERGDRSKSASAHTEDDRVTFSKHASSKIRSERRVEKATTAQLDFNVKTEQAVQRSLDDPRYWRSLTAPPGFSRSATGSAARNGAVEKSHLKIPHCLDVPPCFSKPAERSGRESSSKVIKSEEGR